MSEYEDFISEMEAVEDEEAFVRDEGDWGYQDAGRGINSGDEDSDYASASEDHDDHLETIPESSSYSPRSFSASDWPNYLGLGYNEDGYEKSFGYKIYSFPFCRKHRLGCAMMASVCAIAFLAIVLPPMGKHKEMQHQQLSYHDGNGSDDAVSLQTSQQEGGYPGDIYHRPPSLEEDDLSNHPDVLEFITIQNTIEAVLHPVWFGPEEGWLGVSYSDGEAFCRSMSYGSLTVCQYETYCPGGPGMPPFQSVQGGGEMGAEWLAPLWDDQPLWVDVGAVNVCIQREGLEDADVPKVKYLLCCLDGQDHGEAAVGQNSEQHLDTNGWLESVQTMSGPTIEHTPQPPNVAAVAPPSNIVNGTPDSSDASAGTTLVLTENENAVLENMNPLWYGRQDGYIGATHEEAAVFCKSVGDRELCTGEAYCPNGPPAVGVIDPQPLFLRTNAFPHEQWAPTGLNANSWLLVGTMDDGDPSSTCQSYESLHDGAQPLWGLDGGSVELKEHVMCCLPDTRHQEIQTKLGSPNISPEEATESAITPSNMEAGFVGQRLWFTSGDWKFHTHEMAHEYCSTKIEYGFLCPYEALCPNGEAGAPFDPPIMSSEQWVAIAGGMKDEDWVLVGQDEEEGVGEEGSDRLCNTHEELYGRNANSEEDVGREENTQFILCCGPIWRA